MIDASALKAPIECKHAGTAAILNALREATGFEAVCLTDTPRYVRVLGRMQNARVVSLRRVAMALYAEGKRCGFGADLSKYYFPREPGGMEDVYAWRIIFDSTTEAPIPAEAICRIIANVSSVQAASDRKLALIEEIPINASALRNTPNARGKGAHVTSAGIGPQTGMRG